jgi:hypothetical protein
MAAEARGPGGVPEIRSGGGRGDEEINLLSIYPGESENTFEKNLGLRIEDLGFKIAPR